MRFLLSSPLGFFFLLGAVTPLPAAERTPDVWARAIHHEDGSRTESTRDTNSQTIESMTYDKSGKLVMKRVVQTDAKGVPRQGYIFDGNDKPIYKLGFDYDEIDRLSETSLLNLGNELVMKVEHRYNSDGKAVAPRVTNFGNQAPAQPGEIRPAAAIAGPESTEAVLVPAEAEAQAAAPEKKKRGLFRFFKKK